MTKWTANEEGRQLLPSPAVLAAWFVAAMAFLWLSWPSVQYMFNAWRTQDDYGHGFVVPIFAAVLLWLRRDMIPSGTPRGSRWGLAVLSLWAVMRWVSVYFNYGSLPEYSILVFLAGVAIFLGGWQGLRWSWPSIVFLIFMIPLPGAVQGAASQWLQGLATRISVFVIQTVGIPAMAEGHTIVISDSPTPLDVATACSGLRMMMLFFAMCVGAAFIVRRPLWEKLLLIASAVPIAVASNVARIVLTAVLTEIARGWPSVIAFLHIQEPQEFIHTWVGVVLMMPIGLLLLWGEMVLLSKLLLAPLHERPLVVGKMLNRS